MEIGRFREQGASIRYVETDIQDSKAIGLRSENNYLISVVIYDITGTCSFEFTHGDEESVTNNTCKWVQLESITAQKSLSVRSPATYIRFTGSTGAKFTIDLYS